MSNEAGKRFAGYQIYDQHYEKVGKVDDLLVDENDQPEYIGMKTGLFGGPSALIPMDIVRVNDARQLVEVASDKETIKNAPSFSDDADITAEFEDRVYAHFGATREAPPTDRGSYGAYYGESSDADPAYGARSQTPGSGTVPPEYEPPTEDREVAYPSSSASGEQDYAEPVAEPRGDGHVYEWDIGTEGREPSSDGTGYEESREPVREDAGAGTTGSTSAGTVGAGMSMGDTESGEFREHDRNQEGVAQPGSDLEDEDELRVQRSEEELRAGTREREAGSVNVRKRVRVDRERLSVPTRREEVSVERVPVVRRGYRGPDRRERGLRAGGRGRGRGPEKGGGEGEEIRLRKDVVHEQQIVEEDVRREEVEIEDNTRRRGE